MSALQIIVIIYIKSSVMVLYDHVASLSTYGCKYVGRLDISSKEAVRFLRFRTRALHQSVVAIGS